MSNTENKNLQKEQLIEKQISSESDKVLNKSKEADNTISQAEIGRQIVEKPRVDGEAPKGDPKNDRYNKDKPFGRDNRDNRGGRQGGRRFDNGRGDMVEKVIKINRVVKVVKGGRTFRFTALVVIGDKKGKVGYYNGKATEIPAAIKKAFKKASKNMIAVPIVKHGTIPHIINVKFNASRILLKPARPGTGIIAGGTARAVLELAGIKDIYAKSLGNNNPLNVVAATIKALSSLMTKEDRKSRIITAEERAEMAEARKQKRENSEIK